MRLPVIPYGNPILRAKCKAVSGDTLVSWEFQGLIDNMLETMYAEGGIGLAANQVGQLHNLTVIDTRQVKKPAALLVDDEPQDLDTALPLVLVNLHITPIGPMEEASEGCLSIPNFFGPVTRPSECGVVATSREGELLVFRATGLLSRCIQHENDHLNGVMFMDRFDTETRGKHASEIGRRMKQYKDNLAHAN